MCYTCAIDCHSTPFHLEASYFLPSNVFYVHLLNMYIILVYVSCCALKKGVVVLTNGSRKKKHDSPLFKMPTDIYMIWRKLHVVNMIHWLKYFATRWQSKNYIRFDSDLIVICHNSWTMALQWPLPGDLYCEFPQYWYSLNKIHCHIFI